jgi:hypothetical protein
VLAAPWGGRTLRVLALGSGALWVLAVLSLMLLGVYTAYLELHLNFGGFIGFVLNSVEYVNTTVTPYLAPLLLAFYLHADLRAQILSGREPEEAVEPKVSAGKKMRRAGRGRRE